MSHSSLKTYGLDYKNVNNNMISNDIKPYCAHHHGRLYRNKVHCYYIISCRIISYTNYFLYVICALCGYAKLSLKIRVTWAATSHHWSNIRSSYNAVFINIILNWYSGSCSRHDSKSVGINFNLYEIMTRYCIISVQVIIAHDFWSACKIKSILCLTKIPYLPPWLYAVQTTNTSINSCPLARSYTFFFDHRWSLMS